MVGVMDRARGVRLSGERRERRRGWRTRSRFFFLEAEKKSTVRVASYGEKKRSRMAKQSHKKIEDRLFRPARAHANSRSRSGPLARSTSHARGERRRTQQSSAAVRVHISHVSRRVASVTGAGAGAGDAIGGPPIRDPRLDLHGALGWKISGPRGRRARAESRRRRVRARARLSPRCPRRPPRRATRASRPADRSRPITRRVPPRQTRCSLKPPNHDRSTEASVSRPTR